MPDARALLDAGLLAPGSVLVADNIKVPGAPAYAAWAAAHPRLTTRFVDTPLDVIETRIAENARTKACGHIEPEVFAHHRERFQFPGKDEAPVRLADAADLDRWLAARRGDNVVS